MLIEYTESHSFLRNQNYAQYTGWMNSPQRALAEYADIQRRCEQLLAALNPQCIVLLGMGGSVMSSIALNELYGSSDKLKVIDTTNPDTIARLSAAIDPTHSLFIVASKSGTTLETITLFHHFFERCCEKLDTRQAGKRFIAISDPNTPLVDTAERYGFAAVFLSDPKIGGRFSAFTPFGSVPMTLAGVDLVSLLADAAQACQGMAKNELLEMSSKQADLIYQRVKLSGYGKVFINADERLQGFAAWLEQLLAESTGKNGKGILPIVGINGAANSRLIRAASATIGVSDDNIMSNEVIDYDTVDEGIVVSLRWQGKARVGAKATAYAAKCATVIENNGRLVLHNDFSEIAAGRYFYFWMLLVSALGERLAINPFDQPDVEMAKAYTREFFSAEKTETVPESLLISPESIREPLITLRNFLENAPLAADYIALFIGVDAHEINGKAIGCLRDSIQRFSHRETTLNIAPQYLHTTGQFHKGGADRGIFIFLYQKPCREIPFTVAGKEGSFARLLEAQIAGDIAALRELGRHVLRLDLEAANTEKTAALLHSLATGIGDPRTA